MKQLDAESYFAKVTSKSAQTRRPEGMTFELTYGCNLRCVHCYNPTHRALPHELTTSEICMLLNQIADPGVLTVTFTAQWTCDHHVLDEDPAADTTLALDPEGDTALGLSAATDGSLALDPEADGALTLTDETDDDLLLPPRCD